MEHRKRYDLSNFALTNSVRGTYAILFAPSIMMQITPYGTSYSIAYSNEGGDHYLTMYPKLDEKFFRQTFTSFEMIIFKIFHIFIEDMSPDYIFDQSTTFKRFKRLKSCLPVADWDSFFQSFQDFWYVRDAFSHTYIDWKEINYKGISLNACFGQTYTGPSHNETDFNFVEDIESIFDPILRFFMTRQIEQMDSSKFSVLCDAALRPRSLGR